MADATQTVTKKDLIERISEQTDTRRSVVKTVIQQFLDEIVDEIAKGNRLEFRDFGVFETKVRRARRAQNPRKRQAVWVPQRTTVKFKLGRLMKLKLEALDEERNTAASGEQAPGGLPVATGRGGAVVKRDASRQNPATGSSPGGVPPPAGG